jgi:hypothetical protein
LPDRIPAIYIDFECLAPSPGQVGPRFSHPQLLGVLGADGRINQFLVDPLLHDAKRACPNCCVPTTLEEAMSIVVAEADGQACPVVSWSTFDRNVVRSHAGWPGETLAVLERWYVNALDRARPWAKAWRAPLNADTADERHSLGRYLRATGYERPARIAEVEPARLLRHVRAQLAANGGRYRDVTPQAKRDWHLVLAYNQHDLLGLRHVFERVTADLALSDWYRSGLISVEVGRRPVRWAVGAGLPPRLSSAMAASGDDRYAVLVADGDVARDADAAHVWVDGMAGPLASEGVRTSAAQVSSPSTPAGTRPALLVPGLGSRMARQLARQCGLRLVIWGTSHGASKVLLA